MGKIIALRIRGKVGVRYDVEDTLYMLRLRKKMVAVILDDTKEIKGMIQKIKDYVAFDEADEETLKLLLIKRARLPGNKSANYDEKKAEDVAKKILDNKLKISELEIKPFFALHPPRGGFKKSIKKPYPKGILGKNKKLNELIKLML